MNGFHLTFFIVASQRHGIQPLAEWLLLRFRELGIGGATVLSGREGFGAQRRLHAQHFFDLSDLPVELTVAVREAQCQVLLDFLDSENIQAFYTKSPIEFGSTGAAHAG